MFKEEKEEWDGRRGGREERWSKCHMLKTSCHRIQSAINGQIIFSLVN